MVAAVELDDLAPAGNPARQPDGGHDGLGAGADEAHHLHFGHERADQFGEFGLHGGVGAEGQAVGGGLGNGLHHLVAGMAENQRPPRAAEVDQLGVVLRLYFYALAGLEVDGGAADPVKGADRAVHPAGDDFLCPFKPFC